MTTKTDTTFRYEIITPERYQDVVDFMVRDFWIDEPTCKAVGAAATGQEDMKKYTLKAIQGGMSYMAIDTDTCDIAGIGANGPSHKNDDPNEELRNIKDENFKKAVRLWHDTNTVDLFEKYNVDEVFYVKLLSTCRKYRLKGVATKLLGLGVALAKSRGYKVAKSESTGVFSQSSFRKAGFTAIDEIFYKDYNVDGETVFKNVEQVHPSVQFVVQKLH